MGRHVFVFLLYISIATSGGYGQALTPGTAVLEMGEKAGWARAGLLSNLDQVTGLRPAPVLALLSANKVSNADMYLSFDQADPAKFYDEAGHYSVEAGPAIQAAPLSWARQGGSSARFIPPGLLPVLTGEKKGMIRNEPLTIKPKTSDALFALSATPGQPKMLGSFSISFWLYPLNLAGGEEILSWRSSGGQYIVLTSSANRLVWDIEGLFNQPVRLAGITMLSPRAWSYHELDVNVSTGKLEYKVNGRPEAISYAKDSVPEIKAGNISDGQGSVFVLGRRYNGYMDEFIIKSLTPDAATPGAAATKAASPLQSLPPTFGTNGRLQSKVLDLGPGQPLVLRIEAKGGWAQRYGESPRLNTYVGSFGKDNLKNVDGAEIRFYMRCNSVPSFDSSIAWTPVNPGEDLSGHFRGRYVELAAEFYPSGDAETTPYLESLSLVYRPDPPPKAPPSIIVKAGDGSVVLSWTKSPDSDVTGYLVYYGTNSGVYYGEDSPLDAGTATSVRISGLTNGTLYYFAVAAYDFGKGEKAHAGAFSREISARPGKFPQ